MAALVSSFRRLSLAKDKRRKSDSNVPSTHSETESLVPVAEVRGSGSITHTSRMHDENEDRICAVDDFVYEELKVKAGSLDRVNFDTTTRAFYAVYDGHGGAEPSEYVSSALHRKVAEEFRLRKADTPVTPAYVSGVLTRAFQDVDRECCEKFAEGGTCALVAFVYGNVLYVANAGDSQGLLLGYKRSRKESKGTWLLRDPTKPRVVEVLNRRHGTSDESERQRIAQVGGAVINGRVGGALLPTRSLGDVQLKGHGVTATPEVRMFTLEAGTSYYLVLATDGLWDYTTHERVANSITLAHHRGADNASMARNLLDLALGSATHDDVSVLITGLEVFHRDGDQSEASVRSMAAVPEFLRSPFSPPLKPEGLAFGSSPASTPLVEVARESKAVRAPVARREPMIKHTRAAVAVQ